MADRDLELEVDALKREIKQLTKQLRSTAGDRTREVAERAEDYWHEARDVLDQQWQQASKKAKDVSHQADRYAHEKPWQTAGIAAAAGFLAALLMDRRRR